MYLKIVAYDWNLSICADLLSELVEGFLLK